VSEKVLKIAAFACFFHRKEKLIVFSESIQRRYPGQISNAQNIVRQIL